MKHSDDNYLRRRPDKQYGSNEQGYSGIPSESGNPRQRRLSGGRYGNTAERLPRDETRDAQPGEESWYRRYSQDPRGPAEPEYPARGGGDARYEDEWSRRRATEADRGRGYDDQRWEAGGGEHYGGYGTRDEWEAQRRRAGPRNYRRDDERIHDEVCNRLARDDELDVSDVEVRVLDGVVTLEGKVNHRHIKYDIEEVVERVFGVQDVINHIRVQRYGLLASE